MVSRTAIQCLEHYQILLDESDRRRFFGYIFIFCGRRQNRQLGGKQLLPLSAKLVLIVKYIDCCCPQLTIKCADRPTKPNVGLYGSPKCEKLLPLSAEDKIVNSVASSCPHCLPNWCLLLNTQTVVVAAYYKMRRQTIETIRRPVWVAEM